MRKLLTFLTALGTVVFAVVSPVRAGSMMLLGAGSSGPPPSYTGPGDVVSSPVAAYVLRAFNAADRGNRLIHICDPSNVTCADWSSSATTGKLVVGTNPLSGTDCTTATTCTVQVWYDRSGSGFDASQSTAANRPTFTWSCLNGLPCLVFTGSQFLATAATLPAISPTSVTVSAIANRTGAFTSAGTILSVGNGSGDYNLNYRQVANTLQIYSGVAAQTVGNITDSNFHAFQAAFNGASSDLMCGGSAGTNCSTAGTSNSISPGSFGGGSPMVLCIGQGLNALTCTGGANPLTAELSEDLVYPITFSGTQQTNMTANQYTFWGPF